METLEEFQAVRDSIANSSDFSADIWFGGTYSSEAGHYWVGSGINANISEMFLSYPPTYNNNYRVYFGRGDKKIAVMSKNISLQGLCEEYPILPELTTAARTCPVCTGLFTSTLWECGCYYLSTMRKNWYEAKEFCEQNRGHLAGNRVYF